MLQDGDAVKLSQFCWYTITKHFALRRAELQLQLKKTDLLFEGDGERREYVTLNRDLMSKIAP